MTRTIPQRELRNDNARIIDAVADGETFIVTRSGQPVAELRPIRPARPIFLARSEIAASGGEIRIDHDRFRKDLDEAIDQGLGR